MRAYQAMQDARSMFWLYVLENGLTIVLALALYPVLGVGGLVLAGVAQAPGTYGSTLSPATFQNDEFFAGTGTVTVRPVLTITLNSPDVVVSWSTNSIGFQLQAVGALGDTWADDNTMVVVSGTNNTVTETASTKKFFRLKK